MRARTQAAEEQPGAPAASVVSFSGTDAGWTLYEVNVEIDPAIAADPAGGAATGFLRGAARLAGGDGTTSGCGSCAGERSAVLGGVARRGTWIA